LFVADYVDRPTSECVDRTLDMMMFGIDPEVAKLFVKDNVRFPTDADVTKAAGIDKLLPGSSIQEFAFEPCGYSMNGLLYDSYWTIHITPESNCSYASFETNMRMVSYTSLVKAVLAIFRPKRYTMTLFADEHGLKQIKENTFPQLFKVPLVQTTSPAFMGPCVLLPDGNCELLEPAAGVASPRQGAGPTLPPKRVMNFLQTHKSNSEFMGYSCTMANFTNVQGERAEEVGEAAKELLAMPRAKYQVPEAVKTMRLNRMRNTSF
jgi:Adenosylmethionine decarboxylase